MKKILFSALAAMSLVACVQEQVVDTPTGGAITFENAFIENATKAANDITTANLDEFQVWGYVGVPSAAIFKGTLVTKLSEGAWTYDHVQYWAPNNNYYFAAVAPVSELWSLDTEDANEYGPGVITFENNGATDLVYAETHILSKPAGQPNDEVAFQFSHLLSKVKLTFANAFPVDNFDVKLTGIKIASAKTASIDMRQEETWYGFEGTKELTFADLELECKANGTTKTTAEEYFIIPSDCKIDFVLHLLVDGYEVYEGTKTAVIPFEAFEKGHAYNLSAVINPDVLNFDEITFSVNKVDAWEEAPNASDAAANLIYAAQIGGTYKLTEDVVLDSPVVVPADVDFVLDLNGKTITTELEQAGRHHYAILNNGTMAIEGNGIINARGLKNFGTMVVNGDVTITNIDDNGGAAIWNEGKITINAGTFATTTEASEGSYGAALNTRAGGEAVVNAGTFRAYSQLTYAIVNEGKTTIYDADVQGKHGAVAGSTTVETVIYGGTYALLENPGVSDHCAYMVSAIYGGSFTLGNNTDCGAQVFYDSTIAEGYSSVQNGDVYTVVRGENVTTIVETESAIRSTLKEANSVVYIEAGEYKLEGALSMAEGVTVYGNGASLKNSWSSLAFNEQTTLKNVTIKNVNFANNTAFRMAYAEGELSFKDCVFSHVRGNQSIHFDGKSGAKIVFENCTFYGRNMYAAALDKVIFINCKFLESTWNTEQGNKGVDTGWSGINMWGEYEFNNCQFDKACTCNVKTNGVAANFNGCTYTDGSDITGVIKNSQNYSATINFN